MSFNIIVLQVLGLFILCIIPGVHLTKKECGKLKDKSQIPWTVGIYLENEKDNLELVCLGSVVNGNKVITAAQCVCESLSNQIRKEHIFVSKQLKKKMTVDSNTIRVNTKNVINRKDYKGFLLNPTADLVILKIEDSHSMDSPVCIDWNDLDTLVQNDRPGIIPIWDQQLKTMDATFMDYDSCTLSTSGDFASILGHDKNCFQVRVSDLVPESIGAGIYIKNPRDDRWYLEGVVSAKETSKNEVFMAATSVRHYLSWLSRVCFGK